MFEKLFTFLDKSVALNIANTVGKFADVIFPLIGTFVGCYFVYKTYEVIFDPYKDIFIEYLKTIVALAAFTFMAFNMNWYQSSIVPSVLYSGDEIAGILLGSDSGTGASSLQEITDMVLKQNGQIWDSIDVSIYDGDSILHGILCWALIVISFLGFLPFIGVSTAYMMVAKIMVSFLLIIGPLYIMFGFFPSTRDMFKTWCGQCLNYILLSIVYPLAFNLYKQLLENTGMNGNITAVSVCMTFIIMFALIILSTQIPTFTSTLSGGIGINGLVGGIGASANSAAGLMVNTYKAGKGAKNLAQKAAQRMKDSGKGSISPG